MERIAGGVMLMSGWKQALTAMAAGAFAIFALPPFGCFAAMFVSFTLLVWLMDDASGNPQRGFLLKLGPAFMVGWLFGFGYFVAGLWWLGNALLVEADEFAWALPLAVLGLPAALALFFGLAGALARLFWQDGFARIAALAFAIGLTEWLRATLFTGFPWNAIGQGLMPFPMMMQSIKLVSGHGMNVLAVLIFASPALIATRRGAKTGLGVASMLLAAHLGFGAWELNKRAASLPNATVIRLVQPLIDQSRKLNAKDRTAIFEDHLALSAAPPVNGARRPDYIVWPETSVPFILTGNRDGLARIAETLEPGQVLLAGAVRVEDLDNGTPPRYYNSIYMIDADGQILGAYDKVHLVPFGEYLPLESFFSMFGLNAVAMPGGFSATSDHGLLTTPAGLKLYPLICYEIIFDGEINDVAGQADAILNITNDGWFGNTPGPWQHFHQARLRAAETGLPVIRNSNSGISAIISSNGEVVSELDFDVRGYLDVTLPPKSLPWVNGSARAFNFWILELLALLIAFSSRVSFILFRN